MIYRKKAALNTRGETAIISRKYLREIGDCRALRRLDFHRIEVIAALVNAILAGNQATYFLGPSTMKLGVESL
jgi:hypothetical protein